MQEYYSDYKHKSQEVPVNSKDIENEKPIFFPLSTLYSPPKAYIRVLHWLQALPSGEENWWRLIFFTDCQHPSEGREMEFLRNDFCRLKESQLDWVLMRHRDLRYFRYSSVFNRVGVTVALRWEDIRFRFIITSNEGGGISISPQIFADAYVSVCLEWNQRFHLK